MWPNFPAEMRNETPPPTPKTSTPSPPTSVASGRHPVKKFLGEGRKKKVYLAHDRTFDLDVSFAILKTKKLDEAGCGSDVKPLAMGRLGDHHTSQSNLTPEGHAHAKSF